MYLPTLLKDQFALTPADAGLRTAGFVVLATLLRPVGGVLSDRIGGARVLRGVFPGSCRSRCCWRGTRWCRSPSARWAARRCSASATARYSSWCPQFFPATTATVTGLVGAMGGLGGFFPPLLLGVFRDRIGVGVARIRPARRHGRADVGPQRDVSCSRGSGPPRALPTPPAPAARERLRAGAWATLVTAMLMAAIVVGSRNLQHFDPALVIYTFAVIFATWGIVYHYAVWLQQAADAPCSSSARSNCFGGAGPGAGAAIVAGGVRRHTSSRRRSSQALAVALVDAPVPLLGMPARGRDHVPARLRLDPLPIRPRRPDDVRHLSLRIPDRLLPHPDVRRHGCIFHGLDISAVLVLAGISLALWRRMRDRGALALQDFSMDFLPLIMLFAISVTGLALTASTLWLRGAYYGFLAILHAITVIGALLYLPFGKFFHIFQRPGAARRKAVPGRGRAGRRCVLRALRPAVRFADADRGPASACCPHSASTTVSPDPPAPGRAVSPCKRTTLANAQLRMKERRTWLNRRSQSRAWPQRYGPHGNYDPTRRLGRRRGGPPDTAGEDALLFCGQQCGIQLKVRDNQVIGFEPWEDFPFNKGMLCPKGVKRYMQGGHPDRLSRPLLRTDAGFTPSLVRRGARYHRAPAARDSGEARPRRGRHLRRRVDGHREGVSARQVRAHRDGHAAHRLQRPALHGVRRHGLQARLRRWTARPTLGGYSARRRAADRRRRTSRSARPSPPATSGR